MFLTRRSTAAIAVIAATGMHLPSSLAREVREERAIDCRYQAPWPLPAEKASLIVLPPGDVFRPLLADTKAERFYAGLHYLRFLGDGAPEVAERDFLAGIVAMGTSFGILRWGTRHGCNGVQLGIAGGQFSQFNVTEPAATLLNTDFTIGASITGRWQAFSGRLFLYHQSSHLGDELLLQHTGVQRTDLSYEAAVALFSYEAPHWWRVYAGGGLVLLTQSPLEPGILQGGAELRTPSVLSHGSPGKVRLWPQLGVDVISYQERNWGVTLSAKGGVAAVGSTARVRFLLVFLQGYMPFGQFFTTRTLRDFGFELQLEF